MKTFVELFETVTRTHAGKPFVSAVEDPESVETYGDFTQSVRRLARVFTERVPVADGRVALRLGNSPDFLRVFMALLVSGRQPVLVNPGSTADEIAGICERAEAHWTLGDDDLQVPGVTALRLADLLAEAETAEPLADLAPRVPGDGAYVIFSGGTTGRPKGCLITQANMVSEIAAMREAHALPDDCVHLCVLPMFHASALYRNGLIPFSQGSRVVVAPQFDAASFWSWVERYRVGFVQVVPSIVSLLLDRDEGPAEATRQGLHFIGTASGPLDPGLARRFEERFAIRLAQAYGVTEATCGVVFNDPRKADRRLDAAGRPISNMTVEILDESGKVLPAGTIGEVVVSGPAIMGLYLEDDEAVAKKISDGKLHTGDLGYLDEAGFLVIEGRMTDIIHRAGFKISPKEVEKALLELDGVVAAVVFGVSHPTLGEDVIAYVRQRDDAAADEKALRRQLRTKLIGYKVPTRILPMEGDYSIANFKGSRQAFRRDYEAKRQALLAPEAEESAKADRPANSQAFLWDDVLYLRPLGEADLKNEEYLENLRDPEVHAFTHAGRVPQTDKSIRAFLDATQPPNGMLFAVCEREGGRHVGNALLRVDWVGRTAEFGRFLFKAHHGSDYGTRALEMLMEYAFERLKVEKLWGGGANPASVPSLIRLGFTLEGRLRGHDLINGVRRDKFMVGMLAGEWEDIKAGNRPETRTSGVPLPDEVMAPLREAFEDAFSVPAESVGPATSPRDVREWDSLGTILLWNILEEKFGLSLSSSDIVTATNVEDLALMIQAKKGGG